MAQKSQQSALNELIAEQKLLCEEFDSAYVEVKGDDVVAVAVHTLNQEPIVGLRKKPETEENVAWFITQQARYQNFDNVYAAILIIGVIGLVCDVILMKLGQHLFKWKAGAK
jgi:hypothetical protein